MIQYKIIAAIAFLVAAVAGYKVWSHSIYDDGVQAERRAWEEKGLQAKIDQLEAEAKDARIRQEKSYAIQLKLEKETSDARKAAADLDAALRRGNVRVRDKFTCLPSTSPGDAPKENSGFGAEDAIVALSISREGDQAIRELNSCIDQLHSDRELK